jgi:hypothetical protein
MAVFSKTSSVHSPTRASGRGGNTKKQKDHRSIGAIHPFSSFSLQKLRKRQSALGSRYQSTGISKHYDANHQIYEAFQFHYYNLSTVVVADTSNPNNTNRNNTNRSQSQPQRQETRNNSTAKSNLEWISCAFCLGWNFVETALLELPGHGCFYSNQDPNLVKLRKRSSLAALEVTRLLQRILKLMDSLDMGKVPEETMLLQNNDHHHDNHDPNAAWLLQINRRECKCRLETLKYLAKEQLCEERLDAYEATRKSILSKWRNINTTTTNNNSNNNNDGGAFVPSRFELDSECNDDDDRSAENGATTSLRFMVGNHRGGRLSPPQPPSYDDQDEASHRRSANPGVDCDTVGETFLSCSRLFCPSALPERTGSYTIPLRATRTATLPSSALVDEDQDCDCNDDDDSDNRSDSAVLHSVSNSRPFGRSNNNNNNNTDGLLILQNNNSDDAVFESPIKSHDSQGSFISPPEATTIPTPTRNETEDSSIDSSSRISRRNLKKLKKKNRSKNKKKNNGDETPTKKANKSYPTWLFGKKANVLQHQRRTHEDTDLEEALYQSQLEAAKAASMREEDLIGDLIHGNNNNNSNSYSFDQQRELTSSFSSWSATGHPEVVAAAPQTIQATTDAQHDYDLKRALYLSELQIDESTTTRYQHHDVGTSWNPPLHQRSFEADSGCEREKRDDSAREGPASSIPLSIRQGAVTKGTTVGAPTAVVVKGSPVAPVVVKGSPVAMVSPPPPGAIRRRRNDTDPYSLLRVLRACCRKDFERLRDNKNVVVTRVSTYQGRIKGSTNGCTVIAPLLCVHHFQTRNHLLQNENVGVESSPPPPPSRRLSDGTIASVIDTESPLLLPDIRNSLGVSKNAFLIPHDAHEALIESKHMSRDQFVTVCGGNILEEGHLGALVRELSKVLPDGKKLGATFFFHQHVIAILQLRNGNSASQTDSGKKRTDTHASTTLSFDVIDSLPNKATLPLPPIASSPVSSDAHPRPPNCARIFCKDAASLKATLKWYACSVFTSANERYIDDYEWDEKLTDFDPRVFQAFLWKEA